MVKVLMLGSESQGVRGLSCFLEYRGIKVLVDPGVALGFTRWGLHPHPIQAVAGDEVRKNIGTLWQNTDYVILTHMHGDHVPLYNANPFQLSLYQLKDNSRVRIIAPESKVLSKVGRLRLDKIKEVYGVRVITLSEREFEIGPIRFYGPYPHGMSSRTNVYVTLLDLGEKVMHLSDTGLVTSEVIKLALKLMPDIVITDGPPIYRFSHDRELVNEILRKASENLHKLVKVAHTIIVDHHINRCDEGYEWIRKESELNEVDASIMTAAEYMNSNPLLLEAWRRTLYHHYPINNLWFKKSYNMILEKYRSIYHLLIKEANKKKVTSEVTFAKMLKIFRDNYFPSDTQSNKLA